MGTSTSQPSPPTTNWRLARALLGTQGVAPADQSAEIWRAAVADQGIRLLDALGSPLLAHAADLASAAGSPVEAIRAFDATLQRSGAADLTLDMGRRALGRAVASGQGRAAFAAELFAEAAAYYVSRDLASLVGSRAVTTVAAGLALKQSIRDVAKAATRAAGVAPAEPDGWRGYVRSVVERLQERGHQGRPPQEPSPSPRGRR